MAKQLTLFGNTISRIDPYFQSPKTDYEKYVNKNWEINHHRYARKQDFLKSVLKDWDRIKNNKTAVNEYIEQHQPPPPKRFRSSFIKISTAAVTSTTTVNPLLVTSRCSSSASIIPSSSIPAPTIPNVPSDISDRENYLKANEYQLIRKCLSEMGAKGLDDFFTEEVISDRSLMQTLAAFSYALDSFNSLRTTYILCSKKDRKSQLKARLNEIDLLCDQLKDLLKECADCKKQPAMNIHMITQTYLKKGEIIKDVIVKAGQINLKVSDSSLLNDLRRRIKQQQGDKLDLTSRSLNELTECFCYNNCAMTWEETFDRLVDTENGNELQQPLSYDQLKEVADIISENIVTSQAELENVTTNDAIHQVLKLMPVMLLKKEKPVFINLHEFVFTPGALEAFLLSVEPMHEDLVEEDPSAPLDEQNKETENAQKTMEGNLR